MSTKPLQRVMTENDKHNLSLLQRLYNKNPNFSTYAKSISNLFSYYMHNCTKYNRDFDLSTDELHNIQELVHALQNLKQPAN